MGALRPGGVLRHWKVKAATQKGISLLPRSGDINYVFQQYLTGTARDLDSWFSINIAQAARHLANWHTLSGKDGPPASVAELGTGWHVAVPVSLAVWGAERVITFDRTSLLRPARLAAGLRVLHRLLETTDGLPRPDGDRLRLLQKAGAQETVSEGDLRNLGVEPRVADIATLADEPGRVDLFVSNNVLEHIPTADLPAIFGVYRRVGGTGGVMSHFIDLADHFSAFDPRISSRNFLQYSVRRWRLWDNDLVPQNRLLISDYRRAHTDAGYDIRIEELTTAPERDLRRLAIAPEYLDRTQEDLLVDTAWMGSVGV